MTSRSTPRKIHVLILCGLCTVPILAGLYLAILGSRSHSSFAGVAEAAGAALLVAALAYAALTSVLVWIWGGSPRSVWRIHGGVVGLALLLVLLSRWRVFLQ